MNIERIKEIRDSLPYYVGEAVHSYQRNDVANPDAKPILVKSTPPELVGEVQEFSVYHQIIRELVAVLAPCENLNEQAAATVKRGSLVMNKRTAQMGWGAYVELIKELTDLAEPILLGNPQPGLFVKSAEELGRENESLRKRLAEFDKPPKKVEKGN
jgi:hypothetical protein